MSEITYPTKSPGDQYFSSEANEVKQSVNTMYTGVTYVTQLSDLPTPVSNEIILTTGTYFIRGFIDIGDNVLVVDNEVVGLIGTQSTFDGFQKSDNTTKTNCVEIKNGGVLATQDCAFTALTTGLTMMDVSGSTCVLNMFRFSSTSWHIGVAINQANQVVLQNASFISIQSEAVCGVTSSTTLLMTLINFIIPANNAKFVSLNSSVIGFVSITNCIVTVPTGGFGIDGAADSANLTSGAEVSFNIFTGPGDILSTNIKTTDLKWNFLQNPGLQDSGAIGSVYATGNTATTTAGSSGSDINLSGGGLASEGSINQRFELNDSSNAEIKYIGVNPFVGTVSAAVSGEPSGSETFTFKVLKNGSVLTDDLEFTLSTGGSGSQTISILAPISLVTDDLIKIQVSEPAGDKEIIISQLVLEIQ